MVYAFYDSPLGTILILAENSFLTGIYLSSQNRSLPPDAAQNNTSPVITKCILWLDDYFAGKAPDPSLLPIHPSGTAFQQKVWQMLLQIPYGKTVTYGQLAKQFPEPMSAQAIGQAVGKNPLSIIIPCHRVMGTNNRLTGYAGGIENKIALLKHEGLDDTSFKYPKNYRGK